MMKPSKIPNRRELEKEYRANAPVFDRILNKFQETLKCELAQLGLKTTIKSRLKTFDSYYNKILRLLSKQMNLKEPFDIYDMIGVRIVCPFLDDMQIAANHVMQKYDVVQVEQKGSEHSYNEFGYKSTHFLISVPRKMLSQCKAEGPLFCEIQLRTILQDAWSEVEHELIYKADFSPFDEPMKRKLAALNANLTLSDTLFQEIRDYQRKLQTELNKRRESFMHTVQKPPADNGATMQQDANLTSAAAEKERISESVDRTSKSVDDLLVDALVAHNAGQFKQAIAIYSSILARDFSKHIKSIIHIHRGMAYFAEGRYTKALEDFTASAELTPDNYRAFYYRGLTHEAEQNYQDALVDFNTCLKINPYQLEPLYSRAQLYTLLGDYKKAMADCKQALTIEPASPKVQQLKKPLKTHMFSSKRETADNTAAGKAR